MRLGSRGRRAGPLPSPPSAPGGCRTEVGPHNGTKPRCASLLVAKHQTTKGGVTTMDIASKLTQFREAKEGVDSEQVGTGKGLKSKRPRSQRLQDAPAFPEHEKAGRCGVAPPPDLPRGRPRVGRARRGYRSTNREGLRVALRGGSGLRRGADTGAAVPSRNPHKW